MIIKSRKCRETVRISVDENEGEMGHCYVSIFDDICNINGLFVKSEFRNQGTATKMLEHIVKTYGHNTLELGVRADNIVAIALYAKLGFETVDVFYEGDAKMYRQLRRCVSDWDSISIDTLIYVRDDDNEPWRLRRFAGCRNGTVFAWYRNSSNRSESNKIPWSQARLAEGDEL